MILCVPHSWKFWKSHVFLTLSFRTEKQIFEKVPRQTKIWSEESWISSHQRRDTRLPSTPGWTTVPRGEPNFGLLRPGVKKGKTEENLVDFHWPSYILFSVGIIVTKARTKTHDIVELCNCLRHLLEFWSSFAHHLLNYTILTRFALSESWEPPFSFLRTNAKKKKRDRFCKSGTMDSLPTTVRTCISSHRTGFS